MSGKPYTMREMKAIVEYLVEHKAYKEIKGRKMWMDFAISKMTTRTWQSLKETFLKRILPDIHNPYYKLTMEQARSFREGRDVEEKGRNKLEVKTMSDNSNPNNGENQINGEQPSTSKPDSKEVDETSGEVIKSAKIPSEPRSSADTVVLEAYYNTAEEIKNVLENNTEKNDEEFNKNIRDCLTFEYSPFNIDAMKVLEDFATESEGSDKEPKMEIDENPTNPSKGKKPEIKENEKMDTAPIEISDASDLENNEKDSNEVQPIVEELNKDVEEHNNHTEKQKELTKDQDNNAIEKEKSVDPKALEGKTENSIVVDNTDNSDTIIPPNKTASSKKSIDPVSNSITTQIVTNSSDASLPNNQEALNGITNTQSILNTSEDNTAKIKPQKRSTSTDTNTSKKIKLDNENINNTDKIEEDIVNLATQEKKNLEENNIGTISENPNNSAEVQNNKESIQNDQEQTNNDGDKDNPCLNSVSLYAEQFNTTKYSDSENEVEPVNKKPQENNDKAIEIHEKSDDKLDESQIKVYTKTNKQPAITDNKLNQSQVEVEDIFNEPQEKTENISKNKPQTKLSLKKPEEPTKDGNKPETKHEVLVLKSHSDSVSDVGKPSHSKGKVTDDKIKPRKESLLANMLGFIGGENRKRKISHRRPRPQRHSVTMISDSSDWTSESDIEEYVSPPRGRKTRHSKKYIKPKSARIISLDEEGGLFVMHGKRMFPVVKDGRTVTNYVALNDDSNSEEEDNSYWKQKYVEEKIRADELEKRLKEANSSVPNPDPALERKSPILQSNTLLRNLSSHKPNTEAVGDLPKIQEDSKESPKKPSSQEKLKICFSKNNQEVQLEGYWSALHPALEQVVQLLDTEENKLKIRPLKRPIAKKIEKFVPNPIELETVVIDSGKSTPMISAIDPEVHEKINKIENEIFKEIEDLESKAKEEQQESKPTVEDNSNVTKRPGRGRPRKSAPTTSKANLTQKDKPEAREARKDSKSDKTETEQNGAENETAIKVEKTQEKQNGEQNGAADETVNNVETISTTSKRSSRASKKFTEEKTILNRVTTRRSASKKNEPTPRIDEENVRYMLPPNETKQKNKRAKRR